MSDAAQLVMEALAGGLRASVRLLRHGESLPESFELGFAHLGALDPSWCWVVERGGAIEGCLLASPCHGTALIWRLVLIPGAPLSSLTRLLRAFLRDCRARGLAGYMTLVDEGVDAQGKLKKIMERAGAKVAARGWTLMASPVPERSW